MRSLSKSLVLAITAAITLSCLIFVQFASSQSTSKPTVTEFSLQYIDNSYTVPSQMTSSKDPYTGQITNKTIPGYTVENKTVEATIKNPPGAKYYNFRWRGHFADPNAAWNYEPFNPNLRNNEYRLDSAISVPFQASTSAYSTFTLWFIPQSTTPGGQIDVQVQALYGEFENIGTGMIFPPDYVSYTFVFHGAVSDWSNTQTVTFNQPSPSPTPTPNAPEFPAIALLPLFVVIPLLAAVLMRRYASKTAMRTIKKR